MIDFSQHLDQLTEKIGYQKHLLQAYDSTQHPDTFYQENLPVTPFWNMIATILNPLITHGQNQGYQQFHFPYPDVLRTALAEQLSNAVFRGNKGDLSKKVTLNVLGGAKGGIITATDEGNGYDYHQQLRTFKNIPEYQLAFDSRNTGYFYFDKEGLLFTVADEGRTSIIQLDY